MKDETAAQTFAARYAELQKKEAKPEQEKFATTNGKRYISTEGLTRNEIYKLLHAKTKGKYEIEAIVRSWERSKDRRRSS